MEWEKTYSDALESLLSALRLPDDMSVRAETLHARLGEAPGPERLHAALRGLVDLVVEMRLRELGERRDLAEFLNHLGGQLEALERALMTTEQQSSTSYQLQRKEETALERQVEDIEARVRSAAAIDQIRQPLMQRLGIIHARLDENRGKQASQFANLQAQLSRLAVALRKMEEESTILRGRLDGKSRQEMFDEATGVANRASFEMRLQQEYARWRRYGMPVVLHLFAIDGFTATTSTLGDDAGRHVLREVAAILASNLRETDFLARHGPAQFAILMPGIELKDAGIAAHRLRHAVARSDVRFADLGVALTVSCGYSALKGEDDTADLLERTFAALAQAIAGGANTCRRS